MFTAKGPKIRNILEIIEEAHPMSASLFSRQQPFTLPRSLQGHTEFAKTTLRCSRALNLTIIFSPTLLSLPVFVFLRVSVIVFVFSIFTMFIVYESHDIFPTFSDFRRHHLWLLKTLAFLGLFFTKVEGGGGKVVGTQ